MYLANAATAKTSIFRICKKKRKPKVLTKELILKKCEFKIVILIFLYNDVFLFFLDLLASGNSFRCQQNGVIAAKSNSNSMSYLQKLVPDEVLLKICQFVRPAELCCLAQTCKRINEICNDNKLW